MNKMYGTVVKYDNNFTSINERGVEVRTPLYELKDVVLISSKGKTKRWYGPIYLKSNDEYSFSNGIRYTIKFYKIKRLNVKHTKLVNGGDPEIVKTELIVHYLDYYEVERQRRNEPVIDEWMMDYGEELEEK